MSVSMRELEAARRDPVVFAEVMIGQPLWPHQVEVARSTARYRLICAGRRAGKSRVYGALALHKAFSRPGAKVLIVSAGEAAAKRLFAEVASMARAPLLGGSAVDETTSTLVLSNGSQVECVPASMRQVRSAEADLLIVDEAGFVAQEIWEAAEPVVLARPGSEVLLASTPWGSPDHFFRQLWTLGMRAPSEHVAAWHWPSSVSPLVDGALLEQIRERSAPHYFAREYLAEWTDDAGAFFSAAELEAAVGDFDMVPPEDGRGLGPVVGGVDWAQRRDAQALSVIARVPDLYALRPRYRLVWCEEHYSMPYDAWIERLVEVARGFRFAVLGCEVNGVGDPVTQMLMRRLGESRLPAQVVQPVVTTARSKEAAFGLMQLLMQQGRLELPRHPGLLKQLASLEATQLDGGGIRLSVPERVGHDDLAMSAAFAVQQLHGVESAPIAAPRLVTMAHVAPEVAAYSIEGDSMDFGLELL